MANSFLDALNKIVDLFESDLALRDFCVDKWGKPLTVQKGVRKRTEINLSDLPIVLVVWPGVDIPYQGPPDRDGHHLCEFYCGFKQDDKAKGVDESIQFAEKIDDTLISPEPSSLDTLLIVPKGAQSDRGMYHPVYFFAEIVEIQHRRFTP